MKSYSIIHLFFGASFLLPSLISCGSNASNKENDTILVVYEDSLVEETADISRIPEISYRVINQNDFDNSTLIAYVDGVKHVIGSGTGIFKNSHLGNLEVYAQDDFDGDGYKDALIAEFNPGSGGGSIWAFVTFSPDGSFRISNTFGEADYYGYDVKNVNGKKVIDFTSTDLGKKVVRERHGLQNGQAVKLPVPQAKSSAPTSLKVIDMYDTFEENRSVLSFDLNDDGRNETISSDMSYHFGRGCTLKMNGSTYEFSLDCLWGNGNLHILSSKTNGMHDLMVDNDGRTIYRWTGSTYSE